MDTQSILHATLDVHEELLAIQQDLHAWCDAVGIHPHA